MADDDVSDRDTDTGSSSRFVPRSDDEETLWEVVEITAEKKGMYKVRWKGTDPMTGRPWPLQWVPKSDCTEHLVKGWKKKKKAKADGRKGKRKSASGAAKKKKEEEGSFKGSRAGSKGKGKAQASLLDNFSDIDADDDARRREDTDSELDDPPKGKRVPSRKSTSSTITTYSSNAHKRASVSTKSTDTAKRKRSTTSVTPQPRKLPDARRFSSSTVKPLSSSKHSSKRIEPDSSEEDDVMPPPKKKQRVVNPEPEEEEESSDTDLPTKIGPPQGVRRSTPAAPSKAKARSFPLAKMKQKTPTPFESSGDEDEGHLVRYKAGKTSRPSSPSASSKRTPPIPEHALETSDDDEADDDAVDASLHVENDDDLATGDGHDLVFNHDDGLHIDMNMLDACPPRAHADDDSPVERHDKAPPLHTKMGRQSSPPTRLSSSSPSLPENLTDAVRSSRSPSKSTRSPSEVANDRSSPFVPSPSRASKSPVSAGPLRERSPPPDIANLSSYDRAILEIWERAVGYVHPEAEEGTPEREALPASLKTNKGKRKDPDPVTNESLIPDMRSCSATRATSKGRHTVSATRKAKEMKPIPRVSPGQFRTSITMAYQRASSAASASSSAHFGASSPATMHLEVEVADADDDHFFSNMARQLNAAADAGDDALPPSYEDEIESYSPSPVKRSAKVYSRASAATHSPTFDDTYIPPSQPPTQVTIVSSVPSPPPSPTPAKVYKWPTSGAHGDALASMTDADLRERGKAVFDQQRALANVARKNKEAVESRRTSSVMARERPRSPSIDPDENPFDSVSALPRPHEHETDDEPEIWERPDGIDEPQEEPSKWEALPGMDQEHQSPSKWAPVPGMDIDFIGGASADAAIALDLDPDPENGGGGTTAESSLPSMSPARPRGTQTMSATQTQVMSVTDGGNSHAVSDSQTRSTQPDSSLHALESLSHPDPKVHLTRAEIEALMREEEEDTQDLPREKGVRVEARPAVAPMRHEEEENTQDLMEEAHIIFTANEAVALVRLEEEENTQDLLQEARAMGHRLEEPLDAAGNSENAAIGHEQDETQASAQSQSQSQGGPSGYTSLEVHPPSSARQSDADAEPLSLQPWTGNPRELGSGFGDLGVSRAEAAVGNNTTLSAKPTTLGSSSMVDAIPATTNDANALESTSLAEEEGLGEGLKEKMTRMEAEIRSLREDRERERREYEERKAQWEAQQEEWERERQNWEQERTEWQEERAKAAAAPPTPAGEPMNISSTSALQPPAPSLEDVLAERDATLATALADKALAEKDREFFREQYMQASGFVSSVRIENIELEKKAATADARAAVSDQRAKDGVAGIRALYESRIKTLQDELERERALMRILQERDARTGGDKIRRQAAEAAEIQEELANLREDYEEAVRGYEQIRGVYDRVYEERMYLEKRAKKLKKQKQNLVMQLAELGLQPLDAEVTQDGTTDDGQGVVDGEERESIVIERMVVQEREVSDEEVSDDEDRDEDDLADGPYPPDADESSFDYAQAVLEDVEDLDELFYQCLWRPGNGEHCPRAFDSIEDLERHVRSEHVAATP